MDMLLQRIAHAADMCNTSEAAILWCVCLQPCSCICHAAVMHHLGGCGAAAGDSHSACGSCAGALDIPGLALLPAGTNAVFTASDSAQDFPGVKGSQSRHLAKCGDSIWSHPLQYVSHATACAGFAVYMPSIGHASTNT